MAAVSVLPLRANAYKILHVKRKNAYKIPSDRNVSTTNTRGVLFLGGNSENFIQQQSASRLVTNTRGILLTTQTSFKRYTYIPVVHTLSQKCEVDKKRIRRRRRYRSREKTVRQVRFVGAIHTYSLPLLNSDADTP